MFASHCRALAASLPGVCLGDRASYHDNRHNQTNRSKDVRGGLRHRLRGTLCRGERDIDDEDATVAGHVANTDLAAVRPYRL
jgi:hypothetical protein